MEEETNTMEKEQKKKRERERRADKELRDGSRCTKYSRKQEPNETYRGEITKTYNDRKNENW